MQLLKSSDETCKVPEQFVSEVFVVTDDAVISSVNVTATVVSVDTDETPSEGVIEDTNGANSLSIVLSFPEKIQTTMFTVPKIIL